MDIDNQSAKTGIRPPTELISLIGIGIFSIIIGLLAIDNRSLWTDEIGTWELTKHPSLKTWIFSFWNHYNSDGQIPLYHLYMWIWTSAFGESERTLRFANIPLLFIAAAGLTHGLKLNQKLVACSFLFGSSFTWYYLNEARPYVMHFAGACLFANGMLGLVRPPLLKQASNQIDLAKIFLGSILLAGSSVLGFFWIGATALAFFIVYPEVSRKLLKAMINNWITTAIWFGCLLLILVVVIHSHFSGAHAAQTSEFSLSALAYGWMELIGTAGIGPSRNDLRMANGHIISVGLVLMVISAGAWSALLLTTIKTALSKRDFLALSIAIGLPILTMCVLGKVLHWRVVGRHISAMLPLIILGQGYILQSILTHRRRLVDIATIPLLLISSLISTIFIRFDPAHYKDDYKQAATWAIDEIERGNSVLWLADERGLTYYKLAPIGPKYKENAIPGLIPFSIFTLPINAAQLPSAIIFSPRDGVDPENRAKPILSTGKYRLVKRASAFELYELIDSSHEHQS